MEKINVKISETAPLTNAQNMVLSELCQGYSRKEIAKHTHKSVSAVSRHLEAIAERLESHSAAEIVAKAVALKWVAITLRAFILVLTLGGALNNEQDQSRCRRPCPRPSAAVRHIRQA
jgi:DNA-binding CsgD family transcriptional regulator